MKGVGDTAILIDGRDRGYVQMQEHSLPLGMGTQQQSSGGTMDVELLSENLLQGEGRQTCESSAWNTQDI